MEKIRKRFGQGQYCTQAKKIARRMKLTILFIMLIIGQALAIESYSQETRLSLTMENTTVKEVLFHIEKNSEFFFLYSNKLIDVDRRISLNLTNKKLNEILDEIFRDTDVKYAIKDRQVILSPGVVSKDVPQYSTQQPSSLRGFVTDQSGTPLPGVSVVIKGTSIGTITDTNGNYSIQNIPIHAILQFSFVGMKTREVPVEGRNTVDVTMEEDAIGIEEVVHWFFGVQKYVILTVLYIQ